MSPPNTITPSYSLLFLLDRTLSLLACIHTFLRVPNPPRRSTNFDIHDTTSTTRRSIIVGHSPSSLPASKPGHQIYALWGFQPKHSEEGKAPTNFNPNRFTQRSFHHASHRHKTRTPFPPPHRPNVFYKLPKNKKYVRRSR